MKKILILLLLCSLFLGCRSRQKDLKITEFRNALIEKTDTNTVVSSEKKLQVIKQIKEDFSKKIADNSGDIIIKGKTDSLKPFHFHNVVNGDTLSEIFISGNSDFSIKNSWKKSSVEKSEIKKSDSVNIIAQFARKAVAQSTIKQAAGKIKEMENDVKSNGFELPFYLIIGACAVVLVALWFLFKKINRNPP